LGAETPSNRIQWSAADATHLPFQDQIFDAVISGFLLRNVTDLPMALSEQYRVLKTGGRLVCLDTTKPKPNLFTPLVSFHLNTTIPVLGKLIVGDGEAYTYLPQSTQQFLYAEELAEKLIQAHFKQVAFKRTMFGTIAIHWGVK